MMSSVVAVAPLPDFVGAPGVAGVGAGSAVRWSRAPRARAIAASIAARCSETGGRDVRASVAPGPAGAAPLDAAGWGERVDAVVRSPPPRIGTTTITVATPA